MTRAKLKTPDQYDRRKYAIEYDRPAPELGISALFSIGGWTAIHRSWSSLSHPLEGRLPSMEMRRSLLGKFGARGFNRTHGARPQMWLCPREECGRAANAASPVHRSQRGEMLNIQDQPTKSRRMKTPNRKEPATAGFGRPASAGCPCLLRRAWICLVMKRKEARVAAAASTLACHAWNTGDDALWDHLFRSLRKKLSTPKRTLA